MAWPAESQHLTMVPVLQLGHGCGPCVLRKALLKSIKESAKVYVHVEQILPSKTSRKPLFKNTLAPALPLVT